MNDQVKVVWPPLEDESSLGNCECLWKFSLAGSQMYHVKQLGILQVVASSSEYEKASENNNIVFLLLFGVSQSSINILLLYIACTVLFQPTSLTTGIYWPPSTAKVLHIPKFLTDILQTWCHDTHKNVTNCSEKITFILN